MTPAPQRGPKGECTSCGAAFELSDKAMEDLARVVGVVSFPCHRCHKFVQLLGGRMVGGAHEQTEHVAVGIVRPTGYTPILEGLTCPDANCRRPVEAGARSASLPKDWREQVQHYDVPADIVIVHSDPPCPAFKRHGKSREYVNATLEAQPFMRATS